MRKATKRRAGLAAIGAVSLAFSTLFVGQLGAMADYSDLAIESTTNVDANNAVSGWVYHQYGGLLLDGEEMFNDKGAGVSKPLPGVKVYAQWQESDGSTSPLYTTTSQTDGSFAIGMKDFTKANGETAKFDADPNCDVVNAKNGGCEKWRIWTVNPDTSKYQLLWSWEHSKTGPRAIAGSTIMDTAGGAHYDVIKDQLLGLRFIYSDKTDNTNMHRADATDNGPSRGGMGSIEGRVFWDLWELSGGLDWANNTRYTLNQDIPVQGVTVYGSYLSDYAVERINNQFPGARTGGLAVWTTQKEQELQAWIAEQIAKEGVDKWVAETAKTTTDGNGQYTLQFKGTYGDSWSYCGSGLPSNANAACYRENGDRNGEYVYFHKVADSPDAGTWAKSMLHTKSKHVNIEWVFVSLDPQAGIAQTSLFYNNQWKGAPVLGSSVG